MAWAHWQWERARSDGAVEHPLRDEYEQRLGDFQERHGDIVEAYWSIRDASAVALTIERRKSVIHPFRGERVPRFHRATEWATRDEPAIAGALNHCDTLAVKVTEVLRGSSELIALRRIVAVASHLLGFVDRTHGRQPGSGDDGVAEDGGSRRRGRNTRSAHEFVKEREAELARIEAFYDRAGNKQARIVFFIGMVIGLGVLVPFAAATATVIWLVDPLDRPGSHWAQIQTLLVAIAAGALGALLSVLVRMASDGRFDVDYEVGRKQVRWLGFYRPWLGAIFGVATYLLLASDLLQTKPPGNDVALYYYGALAFLAGFFERFLKIAPGGVPTPFEPETTDATATQQPPPKPDA